jgi:hypothetical protein
LVEFADLAKRNPNHEVVDRSVKVGLQVGDDFGGRVTSRPLRQSSYFSLELLLAFHRPADLPMND